MLTISRRFASLRSRILLIPRCRCIHSGKIPKCSCVSNFSGCSDHISRKEAYGEKEICLLGPVDTRAPLPGNTGIPPISLLYTDTISQLPEPAGDRCEVIQSLLPEERYHNLLTQAACVAAEKALLGSDKLECVGYNCPQLLKKDFLDLFPNRDLMSDNLTVITFCQKTENDMSVWDEAAETERKNLEQHFLTFADALCSYLNHFEYWADFIHPNSGKPHLGSLTSATMFETDRRYRNFGFSIEDLGCCKIIAHHEWGTNIFVGAIFTNAKLDSQEVKQLLNRKTSNLNVTKL